MSFFVSTSLIKVSIRAYFKYLFYIYNISKVIVSEGILNIISIPRKYFIQALRSSEKGFEDFLRNKSQVSEETNEKINFLQKLSFHADVAYILGENKYLVGYNSEELRQFISKDYRNCNLKMKKI